VAVEEVVEIEVEVVIFEGPAGVGFSLHVVENGVEAVAANETSLEVEGGDGFGRGGEFLRTSKPRDWRLAKVPSWFGVELGHDFFTKAEVVAEEGATWLRRRLGDGEILEGVLLRGSWQDATVVRAKIEMYRRTNTRAPGYEIKLRDGRRTEF